MPKDTPSMARNKMKRCFNALLDPHPSEADVNELWIYFKSACAYCGLVLERSTRLGHVDHLVSSSAGGSNDIHNHVLACARCNGDDKREEPWETFLLRKASGAAYEERRALIVTWLSQAPAQRDALSQASRARAEVAISQALASFDAAVKELRALRRGGT
jgi:hypothetical protein